MNRLKLDWLTGVLVGLMVLFQVGALVFLTQVMSVELAAENQTSNLNIGVGYFALIIAESLVLIALWRAWKHLTEWWRGVIRKAAYAVVLLTLIPFAAMIWYSIYQAVGIVTFAFYATITLSAVGAYLMVSRSDLKWLIHDVVALSLGVVMAALIGSIIAPAVAITFLVLMMVWDHYAVNLSDLMGDIVELSSSVGIPNYLIIPNRMYVDIDAVKTYAKDPEEHNKPPGVTSIIGVGDFALPALLTVSAWVAGYESAAVAALVGTCIAMVVLRDSMSRSEGGLPALPWLNTGAIGGFVVVAAVTVLG